MTAYRTTTRGCVKHTDTPNTFRFTTCRKCGARAMDQRVCSVCGRGYCRVCQARAEAREGAAATDAQRLAGQIGETVVRFSNDDLAAARSTLAAELFEQGLSVTEVAHPPGEEVPS